MRKLGKKYVKVFTNLAGPEGIEPSSRVLETPILPVNYGPMELNYKLKTKPIQF